MNGSTSLGCKKLCDQLKDSGNPCCHQLPPVLQIQWKQRMLMAPAALQKVDKQTRSPTKWQKSKELTRAPRRGLSCHLARPNRKRTIKNRHIKNLCLRNLLCLRRRMAAQIRKIKHKQNAKLQNRRHPRKQVPRQRPKENPKGKLPENKLEKESNGKIRKSKKQALASHSKDLSRAEKQSTERKQQGIVKKAGKKTDRQKEAGSPANFRAQT